MEVESLFAHLSIYKVFVKWIKNESLSKQKIYKFSLVFFEVHYFKKNLYF